MTQLDRVEQKLDRLLAILGSGHSQNMLVTETENMKAVLATQGVEGLKKYVRQSKGGCNGRLV